MPNLSDTGVGIYSLGNLREVLYAEFHELIDVPMSRTIRHGWIGCGRRLDGNFVARGGSVRMVGRIILVLHVDLSVKLVLDAQRDPELIS